MSDKAVELAARAALDNFWGHIETQLSSKMLYWVQGQSEIYDKILNSVRQTLLANKDCLYPLIRETMKPGVGEQRGFCLGCGSFTGDVQIEADGNHWHQVTESGSESEPILDEGGYTVGHEEIEVPVPVQCGPVRLDFVSPPAPELPWPEGSIVGSGDKSPKSYYDTWEGKPWYQVHSDDGDLIGEAQGCCAEFLNAAVLNAAHQAQKGKW